MRYPRVTRAAPRRAEISSIAPASIVAQVHANLLVGSVSPVVTEVLAQAVEAVIVVAFSEIDHGVPFVRG